MGNWKLFRSSLFLLLIAITLFCASCGKNKATTMRLIKTDGEVGVENEKGKSVELLDNLGLYSGYGIGTQTESFAWIVLDDTKLTKMDEKSDVDIIKDGKKLELVVNSGSLFFNVTKPLEDDESMDIRTSTTICGIRGTCGWVESQGDTSYVGLLDGKVECSIKVDGKEETVTVNAKEILIVEKDEDHVAYEVKEFTYKDVPEFVQVEIEDEPFALEEEFYTIDDFLGVYSSMIELGLDDEEALYLGVGNGIYQSYSSYEIDGNIIRGTYQDRRGTFTDKLTLNEDRSLRIEFGDEDMSHLNTTVTFEKEISEKESQTEESGTIDGFLGIYARDYYYGLQLSISDVSPTEGNLHCVVGSNMHGGWRNVYYTDYSITGNELKATKDPEYYPGFSDDELVDTFILNDDGSITATFTDSVGSFDSGTYEINDGSVFELTDLDG